MEWRWSGGDRGFVGNGNSYYKYVINVMAVLIFCDCEKYLLLTGALQKRMAI